MQTAAHQSTLDCARHIYRTLGIRGFFRGFGPTMARAFPANAATFMAYEFVNDTLRSM